MFSVVVPDTEDIGLFECPPSPFGGDIVVVGKKKTSVRAPLRPAITNASDRVLIVTLHSLSNGLRVRAVR